MEIIFQNIIQNENPLPIIPLTSSEISSQTVSSNISESTLSTTRNRKRRVFQEITFEMCPFTRKLKIVTWNQLDISALSKEPTNFDYN